METHVEQIASLIDTFKENDHYEFELRVGCNQDGKFIPGVSDTVHDAIDGKLGSSAFLDSTQWVEWHDFFFVSNGAPLRSSVRFDPDDLNIHTSFCAKQILKKIDFQIGNVAVRAALSHEVPISIENVDVKVAPTTHMRIKQRRSHTILKAGGGPGRMRYDMTRSWNGTTKTDAETKQRSGTPPEFEMEIELLHDDAEYLTRPSKHIAESMVLKISDLIQTHSEPLSDWMVVMRAS